MLDHHVLDVTQLRLFGEGTRLDLTATSTCTTPRSPSPAAGDANLGILQGFYRDISSSGAATLKATVNGPLAKPVFSGSAEIANGRVRQLSLPHSLEAINGQIAFDAGGIRINNVRARLAGGDVTFGGRVALNGFAPGELNLTAIGQQMRIRYPEGFVSNIDADLAFIGRRRRCCFAARHGPRRVVFEALRAKRRFVQPGVKRCTARRRGRRRRRCRSASTCR